jgi:murein DD-endopeptidase MepM/ murein hydrolase activator NlpD
VNGRFLAALLVTTAAFAGGCGRSAPALNPTVRHDIALPIDTSIVSGRVPRNATLESLLKQNAVEPDLAASMAGAAGAVFNPRSLRADRSYRLVKTLDGLFREFQYQIDAERFLRVVFRDRSHDGEPQFDVAVLPYPKSISVDAVTAEITRDRSSLVGAFDAIGENLSLPLELAGIFGGEVDFNSDLQPGDRVSVLFERVMRDGEPAGYGAVQGAVLENAGRRLTAVRFTDSEGKPAWYDEQGRSLKRQFLKSPLPFEPRITSRFSVRRLHPIFGQYRAHLGVDYAAPVGTPVVAAAAGIVTVADWSGDAGRMVAVRHAGGYETAYLHLSSFAPGIRAGTHVAQGQLLGRVGATGAATGPLLDYRIKKNGVNVNPVVELSKMPPGEPIAPAFAGAFEHERDRVLGALARSR